MGLAYFLYILYHKLDVFDLIITLARRVVDGRYFEIFSLQFYFICLIFRSPALTTLMGRDRMVTLRIL